MRTKKKNAIRWWGRLCGMLVLAVLGLAPRVSAQALTNNDVVSMVQAKSPAAGQTPGSSDKPTVAPRLDTIGVVYFMRNDGSLVPLEHARAKTTRNMWRTKVAAEIDDSKSTVRLAPQPQMTFFLRVAGGVDPSKYQMFAFRVSGGRREVWLAKGGWTKVQLQPGSLPFEITQMAESIYKLTPQGQLPPGEYGFSPDGSNDAYCFGIDPEP